MKTRTMLFFASILLGFLGYKLFFPDPVAFKGDDAVAAAPETEDRPETEGSGTVEDLAPRKAVPIPEEAPAPEMMAEAEEPEVAEEPESAPNEAPGESTTIKVKAPPEYADRTPVVSLIHNDQEPAGADRERLENVTQSFESGRDAVDALGDQLNALNGTYSGEVVREGREPCPLKLTIDGLYVPSEGRQTADFSGNFQMNFECPNGTQSKGQFNSDFGGHVRVIGDTTKTLLLKDAGGSYFQLSFSSDFQRVMGHAYESQSGSPAYLGKVSAQR